MHVCVVCIVYVHVLYIVFISKYSSKFPFFIYKEISPQFCVVQPIVVINIYQTFLLHDDDTT